MKDFGLFSSRLVPDSALSKIISSGQAAVC
jgi:hypothetical protein